MGGRFDPLEMLKSTRDGYKDMGHPHTNMAKAAVNMLTRTSARGMFETAS